MKKIFLSSLLIAAIITPCISLAATKRVTVDWTMPPDSTSNVINYHMYYSYDSNPPDLSIPIANCNQWTETTTNNFTMTCPTVEITQYPIYFFIAAVTSDGEYCLSPYDKKEIPYDNKEILSIVKNFSIISGNEPPTAMVSTSTTSGNIPLEVSFDASGSTDPDGTISTYSWDFADGNSGTDALFTHTFVNTGTFNVTLTVTDNTGATNQTQTTITVTDTTATEGLPTNISDDFTGDLAKWAQLDGGTFTVDSANNELNYPNEKGTILYTDEQTSDINQWVAVEFNTVQGYAFDGVYFRATNNPSATAYAIRGDENRSSWLAWRYCTGSNCTTIEASNIGPLTDNDSLGVEVEGVGNNTIVRVWIWHDQGIPSRGSWGTPSATFTQDPPNVADIGKYIGLYTGSSTSSTAVNFQGGHYVP